MKTKHLTLKLILAGLLIFLIPTLHADREDNDQETIVAGPNGGRIIHAVEPYFEFFVRDDRKIQITFLNDQNRPIAPAVQIISAIAGDRMEPTHLTFARHDDSLLSTSALPAGSNVPIILTIKNTAEAKAVRERFMVNFSNCSSCSYTEYACVCGHE